ncbi:MAG: 30S ribosomal protein S4e [Candidatus Methanomethylicus sp.]|nr:30S ribosomal protein S4e [Candidatus Methanomethylicus sp.]
MTRHLTTYEAPRFWPIKIKEHMFTVRPNAGPHPLKQSIPLGIVLRDILKFSKSLVEGKKLLAEGKVFVDGKAQSDYKYPVGLMDVIYLKPADAYYRVLPNSINKMALVKISPEEATFKLARIVGKRLLRDGKAQLNFHDGRSLVLKIDDPFNVELPYQLMDSVKLSIPDGQLMENISFEEGAYVAVTGGTKIGKFGTLMETPAKRSPNKLARVLIGDAETTVTLKYIFPIGKGSPVINIIGEVQ